MLSLKLAAIALISARAVTCRQVGGRFREHCNVLINHQANSLLRVNFDPGDELVSSEKEHLGCFSRYEDVTVLVFSDEGVDGPVERLNIPILLLPSSAEVTPLVMRFSQLDIAVYFEVVGSAVAAPMAEATEEAQIVTANNSTSLLPMYPRVQTKPMFALRTVEVYLMIKSAVAAAAARQTVKVRQAIRTLRLLSFYLLEGSRFVGLVLVDLSGDAIKLMDELLLQILGGIDGATDLIGRVFAEALAMFIKILKKELTLLESAMVSAIRSSAALAAPLLRKGWAFSRPILLTSRRIVQPLLQPVMDKAESVMRDSFRNHSSVGQLVDDLLGCLAQAMAEEDNGAVSSFLS